MGGLKPLTQEEKWAIQDAKDTEEERKRKQKEAAYLKMSDEEKSIARTKNIISTGGRGNKANIDAELSYLQKALLKEKNK